MRKPLAGAPVLTDGLGYAHAPEALNAGKAIKAALLHAPKGQRLAHVRCRKVIDGRHPRLHTC